MKTILAAIAVAGLVAGVAQAALLANWMAPGVVTVNDESLDNSSGGTATDILTVSFQTQGGYNCFLMTLSGAPSSSTFSEAYMLNFNYQAGGANSSGSYYIGSGLTGIDQLIDAHYSQSIVVSRHNHVYDGSTDPSFTTVPQSGLGILFNMDGTGTMLEWLVPASVLPTTTAMTVYGSTINPSMYGKTTYDITSGLSIETVPEPTSMALLALGVAAIGLRRKFRK